MSIPKATKRMMDKHLAWPVFSLIEIARPDSYSEYTIIDRIADNSGEAIFYEDEKGRYFISYWRKGLPYGYSVAVNYLPIPAYQISNQNQSQPTWQK